VPVSLSLSGGIDSSAIAGVLGHDHADQGFTAFTTQSGESKGDETHLVRLLVERYPNLTLKINPLAPDSFLENDRSIIHHMDEPFVGQVPYVRWEIARTCHESGFKVTHGARATLRSRNATGRCASASPSAPTGVTPPPRWPSSRAWTASTC